MKLHPLSESSEKPQGRRDKRQLILDAAVRVFARMGYHGARVSDIAREAGIAYGLVYHYFRNKEEILGTIFEDRWARFLDAVENVACSRTSTREKLTSIAALILGGYRVQPDWVKVLVLEIQRSSRFAEPGQIRAVGRLFQSVERILREGQEQGALRDGFDPDVASQLFIGGLEIAVTARVLGVTRAGDGESEDEYCARVARTVVDLFFDGVRAGGVA